MSLVTPASLDESRKASERQRSSSWTSSRRGSSGRPRRGASARRGPGEANGRGVDGRRRPASRLLRPGARRRPAAGGSREAGPGPAADHRRAAPGDRRACPRTGDRGRGCPGRRVDDRGGCRRGGRTGPGRRCAAARLARLYVTWAASVGAPARRSPTTGRPAGLTGAIAKTAEGMYASLTRAEQRSRAGRCCGWCTCATERPTPDGRPTVGSSPPRRVVGGARRLHRLAAGHLRSRSRPAGPRGADRCVAEATTAGWRRTGRRCTCRAGSPSRCATGSPPSAALTCSTAARRSRRSRAARGAGGRPDAHRVGAGVPPGEPCGRAGQGTARRRPARLRGLAVALAVVAVVAGGLAVADGCRPATWHTRAGPGGLPPARGDRAVLTATDPGLAEPGRPRRDGNGGHPRVPVGAAQCDRHVRPSRGSPRSAGSSTRWR